MNDILPKEKKLQSKVQEQIHYCLNCQARDSGEWIWVMGERYDLEQLFDDCDVEEDLRDKITKDLYCPYCGTELNRYDEIGLESRFDKEIRIYVEKAEKKYGKRIKDLQNGIRQYPQLALRFPLARTILNEIGEKAMPVCSIEGEHYRARKVSNAKVLRSTDFFAPPVGLSEEGRFNHAGQSHFYLADDKETAISEIIYDDNPPVLIWLQKFDIKKTDEILDISYDWERLGPSISTILVALHKSKLFMQSSRNMDKWKPDYNITRFVMDCAKYHGYNGIKYNSVRDSIGRNIVLFNCSKEMFNDFDKPEIVIHNKESDEKQLDDMIID